MRPLPLILSTALVISVAGCAAPRPVLSATPATCSEQSLPVTLSATDPTTYRLMGWLCRGRGDRQRASTVQLLVSGLTYDHTYWDSSYQPDTYSYVHRANQRGYATFNIDRIGVGRSDHPPAELVTLQAHAFTVAQVVAALRAGTIGGTGFRTVVGVGHSMGAGILQYEAGTVADRMRVPDYLILQGFLFKADPAVVAQIGTALYPADQDPEFAAAGLPTGYFTTKPGSRRDLFYASDGVDPAVIALDETTKATATLGERTTLGVARDTKVTLAIGVPVLLGVGQYDRLACAAALGLLCNTPGDLVSRELDHFAPRACVSAYVVPGAGHAFNLHRTASAAYDYGNLWLDGYTAASAAQKDVNGCLTPSLDQP
jgi:alpha-beta hydrolase superfamily lysophospholipase